MNILCRLFGHKRNIGWYGDGLYGDIQLWGIDGVGRAHASIVAECDRCGETYTLARLHVNSPTILNHLAKHRPEDLTAALTLPERGV
jgi:hypothetical protein